MESVKKFYTLEDALEFLEAADSLGIPFKFVKTREIQYIEPTDQENIVVVYLFHFN